MVKIWQIWNEPNEATATTIASITIKRIIFFFFIPIIVYFPTKLWVKSINNERQIVPVRRFFMGCLKKTAQTENNAMLNEKIVNK